MPYTDFNEVETVLSVVPTSAQVQPFDPAQDPSRSNPVPVQIEPAEDPVPVSVQDYSLESWIIREGGSLAIWIIFIIYTLKAFGIPELLSSIRAQQRNGAELIAALRESLPRLEKLIESQSDRIEKLEGTIFGILRKPPKNHDDEE